MNRTCYLFCVLILVVTPFAAPSASPYSLTLKNEVMLLGVGGSLSIAGLVFDKNGADPTQADIDQLDKNDVPAFERRFAGTWNRDAQKISDAFLVAGFAAPLPLLYRQRNDFYTLGVMYLETFGLSGGGMLLAKGAVTRYRPFAYGDEAPMDEKLDSDAKRSFFSGHAGIISSGFVFSATVFSDYFPRSRYKPYVWAGAISALTLGSAMRVAGGKHFPSDVAVGILWGSSVGYLVPRFHRGKSVTRILPFAYAENLGVIVTRSF